MILVYVYSNFALKRGTERTLIDKANYFSMNGHKVYIITYEQGSHPFAYALNPSITHYDLDCRRFTIYQYPVYKRYVYLSRMKKTFRIRLKEKVNVINPDVIITATTSGFFLEEILREKGNAKLIVESHIAFTPLMHPNSIIGRINQYQYLRTVMKCDLLVSLTKGDAACWRRYVNNVAVVVNPVTRYDDDVDNIPKESGRIICVGGLETQKRYDRMINAFALIADKYPQWHVDIYGDGSERQHLLNMISNFGLQNRIVLHPQTNDIYTEYKRSELFVLSSDYEGLPLVLIEAMSCGLPIVATDCPFGPADVLDDGNTGLLAEMNVDSLAAKIDWVITHEKEREEMGVRARQASARYKKDVVMKEWESAYKSVLLI